MTKATDMIKIKREKKPSVKPWWSSVHLTIHVSMGNKLPYHSWEEVKQWIQPCDEGVCSVWFCGWNITKWKGFIFWVLGGFVGNWSKWCEISKWTLQFTVSINKNEEKNYPEKHTWLNIFIGAIKEFMNCTKHFVPLYIPRTQLLLVTWPTAITSW